MNEARSQKPKARTRGAAVFSGFWLLASGLFLSCQRTVETPVPKVEPAYENEIREWQNKRAAGLQREDGWLSLIGLHWLEEGRNSFGSDKSNDIVIEAKDFPAKAGVIVRKGDEVRLESPEGSRKLETDQSGEPTIEQIGSVRFNVIKRGERLGLRVKDAQAPTRLSFKGLDYFPIDPSWRVNARFEPYNPPKQVPIPNIIGTVENMPAPGALVFTRDGKEYRIDPLLEEGSDELFIIFKDQTAPRETYGAGRYMYVAKPGPENTVVLDFNKAYNPPCAFTAYATCPLPPPQNVLTAAIRAGEKNYALH